MLIIVIFLVKKTSYLLEDQFWKTEYCSTFPVKSNICCTVDRFAHSVNQCTVPILSFDFEERMANLSVEQKQTLKFL